MEKITLDNGLTLLIHESHSHPVVTLDMWVNTGSANEWPDVNGVSHFLEHMLFKGTPTYGPGEIDLVVEGLGGVWNAGTAKDFTHYYLTVGSEFFDESLRVLADVIINSNIDREEFEKERGVILEEYRRKDDNPSALLYDRIYTESFQAGPYRATVLGEFESIQQLTRDQLHDYYQRYYAPKNMVLVIAGDIDAQAAADAARGAFSEFNRTYAPNPGGVPETKREVRVHSVIEKDINEAYLTLAWPAPAITDTEDIFAMDLLSMILGDGRSSRLYRRLREEQQLATTISCYFPTQKYPSLMLVTASASPEKTAPLRESIEREIQAMRTKTVSRAELTRAKKMAINGYYFSTETTRGICSTLGYYYTVSGDEAFEQNYLNQLKKVKASDIRRVARKYLNPVNAVSVEIRPKQAATAQR